MEVQEIDPYEQQLLAEFESCDKRQQGALDIDGLEELCDKLQLEDLGLELIKYLLKDVTCKRVTFCEFRDGLLSLLRDKQNIKQKSNSDRRSPEREVSPKFVFGTKKYGRRSRPVSTDHEGDQRINLNDSDSEIFVTIDADENEVLMVSNPEEQKQSKKRKSNSETNSPINHVVKQQHRTTDNESDVFNESGDPPSLNGFNESIEEGLREACERLGVGQDGYLDKRELSLLCQAIGMEKMAEEIVQQLFDKLKRDRSGKIGLEEFFLLLRNGDNCFQSVESIDTDTEKINDNFQQTLTNEEHSVRDKDHFLTFGSQNMGFVSGEVLIEMWESAGVTQASALLQELGFSESHQINISELTSLLEDELRTLNEAKENEGVKTVCSPYEPLLHALLVLCQIEIRSLKCTIEHMSAERDKLRADILDANQRASLLAQEVDDHHARLEKSSQLQVKLLEQRFSEQLKDMTEQLSQERDQMTVQNLALERRLASLQEEEAKLRNDLAACKVETEALETENQSLLEQLTVIQESQTALQSQVESLEGLQLLMTEMEGDRQHEEVVPLLEKVSKLEEENMELRDQYDELNTKFENLTAQLSSKMKLSPDAAQDNSEGIEDGDSVGVSVATKRRGDSSPLLHVEDISDEESPRMGKVRRCCKERNLSEVSSAPVTMEDLQPFHLGESSVEANLEIENNMDEKSPNQYDDQGWMCNNITSLAEDEKNVEIERLRSRISALEDELVKQASHSTAIDSSEIRFYEKSSLYSDTAKSSRDVKFQLKEVFQLIRKQVMRELQDGGQYSSSQYSQCDSAKDSEHMRKCYKALECCVNEIKCELTNILKSCSKDDCALKLYLSELQKKLSINTVGHEPVRNECFNQACFIDPPVDLDSIKTTHTISEIKSSKEVNTDLSLFSDYVDSGYSLGESADVSLHVAKPVMCENSNLDVLKIDSAQNLLRDINELKTKLTTEENKNCELVKRTVELEGALDLLRQEYEKTEDYWSSKLDDERKLFEDEQRTSDEKFAELLSKIREYEEMFEAQDDNHSENSDDRLSTIEERASLEKQVTDLEEECEELRVEQSKRQEQLLHLQEQLHVMERQLSLQSIKQDIAVQVSDLQNGSWESNNSIVLDLNGLRSLTHNEDASNRSPKPSGHCSSTSTSNEDIVHLQNLREQLNKECEDLTRQKNSLSQEIVDMERQTPVRKNGVSMHYSYPPPSKSSSQACRIDISVLQTLNSRLKQQEHRYRQLQSALKQQQQQTETILKRTWQQHKEDISELQSALHATQEQLHVQTNNYKEQMEKLMRSDILVKDLYVENAYLVATVQRLEQRCQVLTQMSSEASSSSV